MRPGSAPEVRAPDEVVAEQLRRRSAEDDAPGLHHVAAVGHPESEVGVLLDHEHRGPAPPDVGDDPERRLDERGGQPERRLVEQDEPRPRHQGARDGEHLLLAARERACRLSAALGEGREVGDDALEVLVHGATVAPNVRAHLEVLPDGEVGEDATSLGTVGDAGREDVRGLGAVDRAPVEHDAPARGGEQAGDRAQRGRLAGAVGADHADELAGVPDQIEAPEHRGRAPSATASSTSRCSPYGSSLARSARRWPRPTKSMIPSASRLSRDSSAARRRRPRTTSRKPAAPRRWRPVMTLSATVSAGKTLVRWNVRTIPRAATAEGLSPVSGPPSYSIRPRVGARYPVIALKAVVFPAPFGPITLVIVPGWTSKDTPASAATPPKLTARSRMVRVMTRAGSGGRRWRGRCRAGGRRRGGRAGRRRRASATATTPRRAAPRAGP